MQQLFTRAFQRGGKFSFFSYIVSSKTSEPEDFPKVHPVIKHIFPRKRIPNVLLAGRLRHFLSNWQGITTDPIILGYVGDYKIAVLETPCQTHPLY